jgi:glycosyltransferase involved in cell wall biosynthesis
MPKVGVVIVTHKNVHVIGEAIRRRPAQSLRCFELLVMDNDSAERKVV